LYNTTNRCCIVVLLRWREVPTATYQLEPLE